MSDKITFYHNPMSRGRMVHWMLEESGAPYEVKLLDFETREHKQPSYLAVNPMGKIPAIEHRGVVVTEVAAIISYLADAFPEKKLAPRLDDPLRGAYYRWMFFGAGCIEAALLDKMLNRPCDKPGFIGYGTFDDTMGVVEDALRRSPFLVGDQFTAADLYIGAQLGWGMMMKAVEPKPVFAQFVSRLQERPAAKAANARDQGFGEQLKSKKK